MAIYGYMRYSTSKQEEAEQLMQLNRYCDTHNLKIDSYILDKALSGSTEWKSREGMKELIEKVQPGDWIICSELSRLSRSMSDFTDFIHKGLKPLKARLVICNTNMEIDCTKINAITEIMLQMWAFAAQFERELICERTQAALDYRKELIRTEGGFVSKSGQWRTTINGQKKSQVKIADIKESRTKDCSLLKNKDMVNKARFLRNSGKSWYNITKTINELGFTHENGKPWHREQIKRLVDYAERKEMSQQ